jgi:putative transposase
MATRYYSFAEREFYHIYNRGNSKQIIFKTESDYDRFKNLLYIANTSERFVMREIDEINVFNIKKKDHLVHIGAYCLMPNHFHILITPATEGGVSLFMLKLGTSYSSYFNKKYDRTGRLFENSYKAQYAESDRYLKYLFSYIHLNPYRDKQGSQLKRENLKRYPHSSLPDYLGEERQLAKILSREKFPNYFNGIEKQVIELIEWLDYR